MVRGGAAALVCLQHLRKVDFVDYANLSVRTTFLDRAFYLITSYGHEAVVVFFVLSGFFVGGSVASAFERKAWTWRDYALQRFTRLYVVLIPALFFTLVCDSISSVASPPSQPGASGVAVFLYNLLFVQSLFAPTYGSNSPLWSLAYEYWYYLLFPLLFAALARHYSPAQRASFAVCFMLIAFLLPAELLVGGVIWLLGYGASMATRDPRRKTAASSFLVFFIGLLMLMSLCVFVKSNMRERPGCDALDVLIGAAFAATLPYLVRRQPPWKSYRKIATIISNLSYTMYAIHMPLIMLFFVLFMRTKTATPGLASYARFGCYIAIILAAAALMW